MNSADKQAVLHCLKSMIDEEVCEECPLYGTTGTDHCEKDCVRLAINALSGSEKQTMGHWKAYIHSAYHGNDENDEPIWREVVVYHCSECNRRTVIKENYCPNCGAKMRAVEK